MRLIFSMIKNIIAVIAIVVINSVAFTYVKSYLIKTIGIKAKVSPKKCVREIRFRQFRHRPFNNKKLIIGINSYHLSDELQ